MRIVIHLILLIGSAIGAMAVTAYGSKNEQAVGTFQIGCGSSQCTVIDTRMGTGPYSDSGH